MGIVSLIQRGLIYEDSFSESSLNAVWELSPNNTARALVDTGSLFLVAGTGIQYLFMPQLTDFKEFVMDVKTFFNPAGGEVGGIVVFANDQDYIRLEKYYDEEDTGPYTWIRLVRRFNAFAAYWSNDAITWHIIGSDDFDVLSPQIGLFVNSETDNFVVDEVRISPPPKVTVTSLSEGTLVNLVNSGGTVIDTQVCKEGETQVVLSLGPTVPLSGRLTVSRVGLAPTDIIEDDILLTIWGGDEYKFQPTPDLYYEGDDGSVVPLIGNLEQFLGYVNTAGEVKQIRMIAQNNFALGDFSSIYIALASYHNTDQYSRLVQLANDVDGVPSDYDDSITFQATLSPGDYRDFWLQVAREPDFTEATASELYFAINVYASFML